MLTIWMLWAMEPGTDTLYLVDAWDDDSTDANEEGWEQAKQKAYKEHGAENIRIVKTAVSYDKIRAAFMPVEA